jgi:hypothetical protein
MVELSKSMGVVGIGGLGIMEKWRWNLKIRERFQRHHIHEVQKNNNKFETTIKLRRSIIKFKWWQNLKDILQRWNDGRWGRERKCSTLMSSKCKKCKINFKP